jgi:hypothetical protein
LDVDEKGTEDDEGDEAIDIEERSGDSENAEREESERQFGMSFDHYLAGSAIAFSLGTLLMLLVAWAFQLKGDNISDLVVLGINIIPPMIGSLVSTFLFTRKTRVNYIMDGIKIGFGGFIINYIYMFVLRQGGGGIYILTGFLLGGIFGGFLSKQIYD